MDKEAAENLISNTFNRPFNEFSFSNFIRNFLNGIDESKAFPYLYGNYIRHSFADHVKQYRRVGTYTDPNGERIDVLIVHLKRETALEHARTRQRNFIAWYLNGGRGGILRDAALVAFASPDLDDWRFSYVRMEYKEEVTESGKVKVKEELTPAKRYSFLVGKNEPNHTAQQQLLPLLKNDQSHHTLSNLEDAFSVEAVTKQFYQDYKALFEKLTKELDRILQKDSKIKQEFQSKSIDTANFAKKLLGQIVFLYFLQKKGWLGVPKDERWGQGDKRFLGTLLKRCIADNKNFFNDYLEYLFYEALATTEGRATIDLSYYPKFDCKIPFLNGGLFEATYDWKNTNILLPDELFSNSERTKAGDTGTGILDIFDRYNFTVKEDEPLEKEVAVDPEMLGKVFENLLPENLRKGQGAYYTPREIVHYMCQESLINYLDTAVNTGEISLSQDKPTQEKLFGEPEPEQLSLKSTGHKTVIPKKHIEDFIHKGEFAIENDTARENGIKGTTSYKYHLDESIRKNARLLDEKLETIKICDPAIGSGAFPVGMMHEIVKARNVLETYLKTGKSAYEFKRHCIQESIYGVDIDPGAIEIAKLRLWLSLVVDEENYLDIKPLPNLDYKIMQGNSLIELLSTESLVSSIDHKRTELVEELKKAKDELFNITIPAQKGNKRREIDILMKKLFEYDRDKQIKRLKDAVLAVKSQQRLFEDDKDKKEDEKKIRVIESRIAEIKDINIPRSTEHFEWHINYSEIFQAKGGFDVVVANPPYIRHEGIKALKPFLAKEFKGFYCSTADIYTYFYKRGLDLLKSNGCLCFIAPNKFMRATYGKNTRHLLTNTGTPRFIIDFCDLPIFDATTYPAILLIEKNEPDKNEKTLVTTFRKSEQLERIEDTISSLGFQMPVAALKSEGWTLETPRVLALMEKIRGAGTPLGEYVNGRFYYGIKTGLNEAFVIDADTRERLITEDPACEEIIKPWLRGRDIRKWKTEWAGLYIINIPSTANKKWPWSDAKAEDTALQIFEQTYPSIHRHLSRWEKKLKKRDDQGKFWWELRSCAYHSYFENPKIVYPDISQFPKFTWDESKSYLGNTAYIMPLDEIWLIGLLNSKLMNWFYSHISPAIRGGFFRFIAQYMEKIPVVPASEVQKAPIVERVRTILKNPDGSDIPNLEAEINTLIYELYGLTVEEIDIVEERVRR